MSLCLETPLCQRNRRLLARKYIPIYQGEERQNDAILEFAKLDFNLLQSLHQEEFKKNLMQIKALSRSYFIEVRWGIENYVPTLEEHLSNSLATTGYSVLTCASYVGMGPVATKEVFEWVASFTKILKASTIICRLMDVITSHQLEQQRDHAASTVECYMKEFATDEKETTISVTI